MTAATLGGLLFSSKVLRAEWFFYLSSFVAFNTIVFVGLSIGRFVYWPRNILIVGAGHEDAFAEDREDQTEIQP